MVWGSGFGVGCYVVCVGNVDFGLFVWWFTVNSYCLVACCWRVMGCLFVCFICVLLCICRLVGFGLWVGLFYCGCWF